MKTFKLWVHQKKITDKQVDEILINPKECTQLTVGDVVEIYHPEEEFSRLLLQIKTLSEDFQQKEIVSIEQSIATAFQLKAYQNVYVNKVDKQAVTLAYVEVLFKEHYFSRSDMHRMRNNMIGTCVYLNKKIVFSEMRTQVNELLSKGEKVTCGVISEDTRIVFRSSTAVVQIFMQMSSEMWDFDINGDLYFEKAVNGFLMDLFAKWKEQNCCHDVTIVMFSRTYYDAQSRDEFPSYMQECLQQDYKGKFYEDFYRIVIQNERYDEWTRTIKQMRKIFNEYPKRVLSYHKRPGFKVPKAYNSTAAQGNFLETLNMTLNLFEKYYLDRNFDRTGKVAVVITPGAGVFEVDRELTNITKQRTIDCGVGSDLVCMGEQPLHAAPLFKFHSKYSKNMLEVGDDYNIPHWMNHSFYTSKNQIQFYSNRTFVPRIKIPPDVLDKKKGKEPVIEQDLSYGSDDDNFPFVDYDEYDAQVFKLPTRNIQHLGVSKNSRKQKTLDRMESKKQLAQTFLDAKQFHIPRTRHISDDISSLPVDKPDRKIILASSPSVSIPSNSSSGEDLSSSLGCYPILEHGISRHTSESDCDLLNTRPVVGSAGSPVGHSKFMTNCKRHRALINPFAPSRMQFKMTSNRRRWVHAFPTDPYGAAVQTHHVHTYSYHDNRDTDDLDICEPTPEVIQASQQTVKARKEQVTSRSGSMDTNSILDGVSDKGSPNQRCNEHGRSTSMYDRRDKQQKSFVWGPTGEQEWSPELTTGLDWRPLDNAETKKAESQLIKPILTADIENTQNFCAGISVDWKSLTMPASLPITTDYLPDMTSLQNDYVVSDYSLLPDDVNIDYYTNPPVTENEKYFRKQPLTTKEVFNELISQRLAQGFQTIIIVKTPTPQHIVQSQTSGSHRLGSSPQISHMSELMRARPREEKVKEVYLSIGRIFHKLTLSGRTITVTRYRPRHPNLQMCYSYKYRFQAPDSLNYDISWSDFKNEKLENYNWNYLDQYICTQGEGDYGLMESLKFWRSRFFILPCTNQATKKIIEGHPRCDIYEEKPNTEHKTLVTGFTRYLEILNKMKRTAVTRKMSCKHTKFLEENPGGIPSPDTRPDEEVLSVSSPSEKIREWMLDPECGIPMLPKQHGLPEHTFISAEIEDWCYYHVYGVKGVRTSMDLLQRVLDDGLIIHASGNPNHKMLYGFYLYCVVDKDKTLKEQELTYNPLFQNDWCEVAILPVKDEEDPTKVTFGLEEGGELKGDTMSLQDWKVLTGLDRAGQTWAQQSEDTIKISKTLLLSNATLLHKYVNVEVDPLSKSDRKEWSTARYHAFYSPHCAFELQVHWMVTTGCILNELVNNWVRKASSCCFHVLPVPVDPFALPSAPDSDPLRGPIFVPLDIRALEVEGRALFSGDDETKHEKLFYLQETIIKRFGFIPTNVRLSDKQACPSQNNHSEEYQQYVHCTGGMFVIIEGTHNSSIPPITKETKMAASSTWAGSSNENCKDGRKYGSLGREFRSSGSFGKESRSSGSLSKDVRGSGSLGKKSSAEMRKDYIARQTSEILIQNQATMAIEAEIGFLWSWNFMSSKKWRSKDTGDEYFQDKVFRDFRAFCTNDENRLHTFWMEYQKSNTV